MNRRNFLRQTIVGGAIAVGTGSILFARREYVRAELHKHLLTDALNPLEKRWVEELDPLAERANNEIKRYFHGLCLNVQPFISHICSDTFRERLDSCNTDDDRHQCLFAAFCSRVATEAEILNQVDIIATEIGSELDTNWEMYCRELSSKWSIRIPGYSSLLTADALNDRVSGMIRSELSQALKLASTANQTPALGQTVGTIGKSAVMLLPLVRMGNVGLAISLPLFVVLAGREVWKYVLGRLDDRRADFQTAISARLALLGIRVGAEFQREIRHRLTDLRFWQERSLRETANFIVQERVGLI